MLARARGGGGGGGGGSGGVITEKTRVVDGLRNPDICRFSGNKTRVSFARERVRERPYAALPHADKEKCPEIRNPPRELFHRRGERPSLIFFFRKFFLLSFSRLSSARFTQPLDGMEQQARDRRERHILLYEAVGVGIFFWILWLYMLTSFRF